MKPIRKAIFPVAGLGTRLLPATKTMPKEMLTIVDRPLIQYAVDEAREAGIEQLIFVTGRGKASLVDYFDMAYELEHVLDEKGKTKDSLSDSRAGYGELVSVRQQQPLGLGHAIWCARHIIGDEPFAVLLPDDLLVGRPGALKQMVEAYAGLGGNLVCTQDVAPERTAQYGIIDPGKRDGNVTEVRHMVEKPEPEAAPSTQAIVGRYILQPEVMDKLASHETGAGGEIQLTDAMVKLLGEQPFHAVEVDAVRHDCGNKTGFVLANLAMGLEDGEIAGAIRDFLDKRA